MKMQKSMAKLKGLVLTGGSSRRMGQPKALLVYHGLPEAERMYHLLSRFVVEAFLSVAYGGQWQGTPLEALPAIVDGLDTQNLCATMPAGRMGLARIRGPMLGIASAMHQDPEAAWLVAACDMPLVDETLIMELLAHRTREADATVFVASDGHVDPLLGIYEPAMLGSLTMMKRGIEEDFSMRRLLDRVRVRRVVPSAPALLANMNAPSDMDSVCSSSGSFVL